MPELPDIEVYIECLRSRILHRRLEEIRLSSPFLLRSALPPIADAHGKEVVEIMRLGKRIALGLSDDLFLVMHLMIAGRLQWKTPGPAKIPGRYGLAAFDFENGSLVITEAGSRKRASLYLVRGEDELSKHNPGGLEVLEAGFEAFRQTLLLSRHTLKRTLTDPHILSGIGNAYSDEILHHAGLSPFKPAHRLDPEQARRLYESSRRILTRWTQRLREQVGEGFPRKVTAFRPEMAVHGRYRQPCPSCGTSIERIVYASNESNYCPGCQTGGRILADRALSRLLRQDWPRTLEELEKRRPGDRRHKDGSP